MIEKTFNVEYGVQSQNHTVEKTSVSCQVANEGTKGSDVLTRTRDHEKAEAQPLECKSPRLKLALCSRLPRSSGSIYNGWQRWLAPISRAHSVEAAASQSARRRTAESNRPAVFQADGGVSSGAIGARAVDARWEGARVTEDPLLCL
jgi:hypothetical protein